MSEECVSADIPDNPTSRTRNEECSSPSKESVSSSKAESLKLSKDEPASSSKAESLKSLKSDEFQLRKRKRSHNKDESSSSESDASFHSTETSSKKSKYSQRTRTSSKLCPKRRTCVGVCFCVIKVIVIVSLLIVLFLAGFGYLLTKLDFQCKIDELEPDLYSNLYGQDVAVKKTLDAVTSFCSGTNIGDPLTLVFWGPSGVGKTSFASIFTNHFDSNGQVVPSEYFKAAKYKDWFGSRIHNNPFVYTIDDVMSVKEMHDIVANTDVLSFPLILVLTTSLDSHLLNDSFIDWCMKGGDEADFVYKGADPSWLSELSHLNPVIVPFLPLSRTNVKLCIEKTLNRLKMKYGKDDVEKIANEFEYFNNGKRLYSKIGCKRVNDKVFSILAP